jgi:hypothetical protein
VKIYLNVLLFALFAPQALACISVPKNIKVDGATFADAMQVSLGKNCYLTLGLRSQAEVDAEEKAWAKQRADQDAWLAAHPKVDPDGEEASQAMLEIEKKYPKVFNQSGITSYTDGNLCVYKNNIGECSKETSFPLMDGSKTVGLVEVKDQSGYVWSVDGQGKKDKSKPFLQISRQGAKGKFQVNMMEHGKAVGKIYADTSVCTKGIQSSSGEISLRGFRYIASPGCDGGYDAEKLGSGPVAVPADATKAD